MEENMISSAEIHSLACLNKKRKFQAGPLGMPFTKHVCWDQRLEYDNSSSDSRTEPKKVRGSIFARGSESDQSAKDSYSFHGDADSVVTSTHDDAKTYLSYPRTPESFEPSSSCARWDGTSAEIDLYSLDSRSVTKPSSSKSESFSICEELDYLQHEYGLCPSDSNYEDHLSFSEYQNDLDNLHSSNRDFVLSSGRWSVNQVNQQGTKKLTIDKEFEEYFSMLML